MDSLREQLHKGVVVGNGAESYINRIIHKFTEYSYLSREDMIQYF